MIYLIHRGCGGMVDTTDLKSVDSNSRVGSSPTTPNYLISFKTDCGIKNELIYKHLKALNKIDLRL